jgi:uncharacterized protein YvpB
MFKLSGQKYFILMIIILVVIVLGLDYWITREPGQKETGKIAKNNIVGTEEENNKSDGLKTGETLPENKEKEVAAQLKSKILMVVPFTSQAPTFEWDNPVFQDGCEETAALMAVAWVKGESLGTKNQVKEKLIAIADWQEKNYGDFRDTSAEDTVVRIFKGYFGYDKVEAKTIKSLEEIKTELNKGNLVIVPTNGQALENPYYTPPGPERHNLVIIGYDDSKDEFITNDSGTRMGAGYVYNQNILWQAIRDYPTGDQAPIEGVKKTMLVVGKND